MQRTKKQIEAFDRYENNLSNLKKEVYRKGLDMLVNSNDGFIEIYKDEIDGELITRLESFEDVKEFINAIPD